MKQTRILPRLALAVPLFAVVTLISQLDFSAIWRYFGWGNQCLACFTLWSIAICLRRKGRNCLMAMIPALFMTCMCTTFLLHAPECAIDLPLEVDTPIGCAIAAICLVAFCRSTRTKAK